MPDLRDSLLAMDADPLFKTLDYPKQVMARRGVITSFFEGSPEFATLDEAGRGEVVRQLAYQPPSMETDEGQVEVKKWLKAAATYRGGDFFEQWKRTGGSLTRVLQETAANIPAAKEYEYGLIRSAINESMVGAVLKEGQRAWAKHAPGLAVVMSERVLGKDAPLTKSLERTKEVLPAVLRDASKVDAFIDYQLSTEKQFTDLGYGGLSAALKTGTNLVELASMSTFITKSISVAKWGGKIASNFGRGAATVAKVGAQVGAEGVTQFARDVVKLHANEPDFEYTLGQLVGKFGWDVALNSAAVIGAKVLPPAAKALRHFVDSKAPPTVVDDVLRVTDDTVSFRPVDPVSLQNTSESVQKVVAEREAYMRVASLSEPSVDDILKVQTAAHSPYTLEVKGSTYHLVPDPGTTTPNITFKNREGLEKWLGTKMADDLKASLSDEALGVEARAQTTASKDFGVSYQSDWTDMLANKRYGTKPTHNADDSWTLNLTTDEGVTAPRNFRSLDDLGDFLVGDVRGGIDPFLMPNAAVVADDATRLTFTQDVVQGNRADVYRHMSVYRDRPVAKLREKITTSTGTEVTTKVNHFEVYDPRSNYRRKFDTVDDLREWLSQGENDVLKLEVEAADKGYGIGSYAGGWYLYGEGGNPIGFRTMDDVRAHLKTIPIPEKVPNAFNIPEAFDEALHVPVDFSEGYVKYQGAKMTLAQREAAQAGSKLKGEGLRYLVSKTVSPVPAHIEYVARRMGGSKELASGFNKFVTAANLKAAEDARMIKAFDDAMTIPGRKPLKVGSKEDYLLGPMLQQKTRADAAKYLETEKMDRNLIDYYDRYRDFMGRNAKRGLASRGQIGRRMAEGSFEEGYVPRMEDAQKLSRWFNTHKDVPFGDEDVQRVLKDAGINEAHLPFFRNARKADLIALGGFKTPMEATHAVIAMMNREVFMAPAVADFRALVNKEFLTKKVPEGLNQYLVDVMDMVDGKFVSWEPKEVDRVVTDWFNKTVKRLAIPLGEKMKPAEVRSLVQAYTNLTYSAAMGYRPYAVARNLLTQPLLLMGPWLGNDFLVKAWKAVANLDIQGFETLIRKGVLLPGSGGSYTGGVRAMGLKAFKSADDITRAVAWFQSKARFDEAKALKLAGRLRDDVSFLKRSGVWTMDEGLQKTVLANVKAGKWDVAQDLFSRTYVQETLFPVMKAANPRLLQGRSWIGRMFGTFGSYPLWYISGVQSRLGRVGMADKVGFAARMALNAGLAVGLARTLGIRDRDWTPWGAASLPTGGPHFQLLMDGVRMGMYGYRGRQARADVAGIKEGGITFESFMNSEAGKWGIPVPGRIQWTYMQRAWDHAKEGDYYQAIMSAAGVPLDPRWKGW